MRDIHIAEFEKLKDEQISRAAHRDRLFHLTLILIGGGGSFALATREATPLLLLLPYIAFIAGMSHVACDRRISAIGSYFREVLAPKLAATVGVESSEIFAWEDYITKDSKRYVRKWLQLFTNLLLYVGTGLVALAYYGFHNIHPSKAAENPFIVIGLIGGLILMVILTRQLTHYSHLKAAAENAGKTGSNAFQVLLRVMLSAVFAVGTGWLVLQYGPMLAPSHAKEMTQTLMLLGTSVPATILQVWASAAALIVLIAGIFMGRR